MKARARTIALAIALFCANTAAHAQNTPTSPVFAPNELIVGMPYSDWTAAWWQFYLQIPNVNNSHPFAATANTECNNGNQPAGPVFFLAAVVSINSPAQEVVRNCVVPAGSPILFPIANNETSNLEINGGAADLRTGAFAPFPLSTPPTMSVSLDGVSIGSLSRFRFESPVFPFTAPTPITNFFFYTKNVSNINVSPLAVSDGYWLAIKPLPKGEHTLCFTASFPVPGANITVSTRMLYHLTVK
jgi:hypothetical protein